MFLFVYRILLRDSSIEQGVIAEIAVLFLAIISINVFYFYDVYKKIKRKKVQK